MFDLDGENLWMGPKVSPRKPRYAKIRKVYRQAPRTKIVYVERRPTRRKTYKPKQPQYTTSDYARAGYKGLKATYKGTKKTIAFGKKIGQRITDKRLTGLRQRLKGSIY